MNVGPADSQNNGNVDASNTDNSPSVPTVVVSLEEQGRGGNPTANVSVANATAQRRDAELSLGQADDTRVSNRRRASRKQLGIIGGIGAASILITASAMKAAGYTYHDIQWPVTVEIMILTIFLTPSYANSIA
ncbi:hypothetical protein GQX73_g2820 [Xylaria multiplex]|uniref:Uncharacterized protein n=1 Tax=Xylaria multiplex TaxID=323545 RepID=A0A7C8IS02_9PEZI|nr:hypothetical protein GQX73_g2820 [Xylaria multiplex]